MNNLISLNITVNPEISKPFNAKLKVFNKYTEQTEEIRVLYEPAVIKSSWKIREILNFEMIDYIVFIILIFVVIVLYISMKSE